MNVQVLIFLILTCSLNIPRTNADKDPNKVEGLNSVAARLFTEVHEVTTEDGYILTLHRMPGPPGSIPVFFLHGYLESSGDFVVSGPSSLPYLLQQRGYDIWLGNVRGNTFSRKHKTLTTADPEFWNYSFTEWGLYDAPAMISYITEMKNSTLFYIGHSMGATTFSVMSIEKPEMQKKIKLFVGLAPAPFCHGGKSPFELLAPFWGAVQKTLHFFGIYYVKLLGRNILFDFLAKYVCPVKGLRYICAAALFTFGGWSPAQLDFDLLPILISELPSGSSTKLLIHFLQQVHLEKFRKFDHGREGNLLHYNSTEPPYYDLTKIHVPSALFYSRNDFLVNKQNALDFYKPLRRKVGLYESETFNHFDFILGRDAPELIYSTIFDLFTNYENGAYDT